MLYSEFNPGNSLKDYVQCYFVCVSESTAVRADNVFASGTVEMMFNVGEDGPQQLKDGDTLKQPDIQLWGQTIQPFTFTSFGKHAMFGVRFFTHTAACFFPEPIASFNNQVVDYADIGGKKTRILHSKLREAKTVERRIGLMEAFLMQQLLALQPKFSKVNLVSSILQDLRQEDFFENIDSVSARYGISTRYLQKIFQHYCGLSPNLFSKIARFQKSIHLVTSKQTSLTAIAHHCGYFDQSHFIKDFKFFTGATPSRFSPERSTDLLVSLKN